MKKLTLISVAVAAMFSSPLMAEDEGARLFKHHGCISCHGENAKNPASKIIPVLAGKPSEVIFEKAKKILTGEGASKEAQIMHAAFYSPSSCDVPPTDAELVKIADWASKQ